MFNSSRDAASGMRTACGWPGEGAVPFLSRELSREIELPVRRIISPI